MPYYEACQELYNKFNACLANNNLARLLNKCDVEETELLKCMRREYLTRKRESRGKALERQERLDAIIAETGVDPIKGHSVKPKPKKEDSQQNAGATGAAPAPASA